MDATGELRLLAVQALKEQSLLHAKYVLARYDQEGGVRKEVGELPMTRLGYLVDRLHAKQQLVFA